MRWTWGSLCCAVLCCAARIAGPTYGDSLWLIMTRIWLRVMGMVHSLYSRQNAVDAVRVVPTAHGSAGCHT